MTNIIQHGRVKVITTEIVDSLMITKVSTENVRSRSLPYQCFVAAKILPMIWQASKLTTFNKGKREGARRGEGPRGWGGGNSFSRPCWAYRSFGSRGPVLDCSSYTFFVTVETAKKHS